MHTTLVQQLGSLSVSTRDLATQGLVRMGIVARQGLAELLRGDHDPSLLSRAAFTLAGIRPAEQEALWSASSAAFPTEPSLGTVSELLAWLNEKHRVRATCGDVEPSRVVQVNTNCRNILAYLDALCHKLGASWVSIADGIVQLSSMPEAPFPVCYAGPFRTRLISGESLHTTDYRSCRHVVTLGLDVTAHSMLSPVGAAQILDLRARDDRGFEHRFRVSPSMPMHSSAASRNTSLPSLARTRDILTRSLIEPPQSFLATAELLAGAHRFEWICGRIRLVYTASYTDVAVDDLCPGHRVKCDDGTEILVEAVSDYDCSLSIAAPSWESPDGSEHEAQLISSVALGINQEGRDALATLTRWVTTGSDKQRRAAMHLFIDNRTNSPLCALRLRLIGELREAVLPFRFEDVELP